MWMPRKADMFTHFSHKRALGLLQVAGVSVIKRPVLQREEWSLPWGAAEAPRPTAAEQVELKMKTDK